MEPMVPGRIGAGWSTRPRGADAGREAARAAAVEGEVDLAFVFLSPAHLEEAGAVAAAVREELAPAHLVGCVADGVVGRELELEEGPAAAVWAASLPGATIEPFHVSALSTGDGVALTGLPDLAEPTLVAIVVDPFTFPAGAFLDAVNRVRPGLPLVGGIAVGGGEPGAQALLLGDEVVGEGAVGVALAGVPVVTCVSQGCTPIGRDAVVTSADGNVVRELAGESALARLRADLAALAPEEATLAARGLLAGIVIDENRAEYGRGDYLMRGLLGVDETTGAIALSERVRVGQTLRFHVRDAASADADLRAALGESLGAAKAAGALLFTCNGRGRHMFEEPGHDARLVASALARPALAGVFCGGEIGPVGGRAFLHGFTATAAFFLE